MPDIFTMWNKVRAVGKRVPEFEPFIMINATYAVAYAEQFVQGRWLEAEPYIMINPHEAIAYATRVIKGRWPEAETYIKVSLTDALDYAEHVIQGRWPEAEIYLFADVNHDLGRYYEVLQKYSHEDQIQWLKDEGFIEETFRLLNFMTMYRGTQEFVLQQRSDLVGKIKDLFPDLKAKYSHELELAGVDL